MKYKVGDKVRIVSDKGINKSDWSSFGKMDKWLGKVMTVRSVGNDEINGESRYLMEEDIEENKPWDGWSWFEDMIEEVD